MDNNKFTYKDGDFVFTPSQCIDCTLNISIDECEPFSEKPEAYLFNREECPERTTSEK